MKLSHFAPPGNVSDFPEGSALANGWSRLIADFFDGSVAAAELHVGTENSQFYNPVATDTTSPSAEKVIGWIGFPKVIARRHPGDSVAAWAEAENLRTLPADGQTIVFRPQDEYLEWHVTRNAAGKVTRVTFTCEGPEYWQFLAENDPETALRLYREHIDPAVNREDLFQNGSYNRWNKWNTERGAMHLTHPANSLSAEIRIAADASVLRERNGQLLADADALIRCARYGVAERASDPRIGSEVNTLARAGWSITLKDPVGLYIGNIDTVGWTTPDGSNAADYWRVLRGSPGAALRAVYEVPADKGFVVGDIQIGGIPIDYGGQLAEAITVKLTGVACRQGQSNNEPVACETGGAGFAATLRAPIRPSTVFSRAFAI